MIGHSSPAFCHEDVATTMKKVALAGFDLWEVVAEGLHAPWEHRSEFKQHLPSYDLALQLHAPLSDCNLGSLVEPSWELALKTTEKALRGARAVGAKRVTIHPGNHTPLSRGHYPRLHEQARKAVRRLDKVGREFGLELCLENMPLGWAFETVSLDQLVDLTHRTEFRLTYDLGHAHVSKRLDEFDGAAKRFGNMHIHDNRGATDDHLTLDEGDLPWRRTVDRLVKGGYKGPWIIESRGHDSGQASLNLLKAHLARAA